jgi:hypothetical protein
MSSLQVCPDPQAIPQGLMEIEPQFLPPLFVRMVTVTFKPLHQK